MTGPVPSKGCGDNSCIHGRPSGMGTNGGCSCEKEQRSSKERIGFLIDYWTAKSQSHKRWPEGQGMQAELMGLIYDHTIAALKQMHSTPEPRVCPTCQGNDRDTPCAYPSEGKPGCLRDKRLAQPPRDE